MLHSSDTRALRERPGNCPPFYLMRAGLSEIARWRDGPQNTDPHHPWREWNNDNISLRGSYRPPEKWKELSDATIDQATITAIFIVMAPGIDHVLRNSINAIIYVRRVNCN